MSATYEQKAFISRQELARFSQVSSRLIDQIRISSFNGRPLLRPVLRGANIVRFAPTDVTAWLSPSSEPTARCGRGRPRHHKNAK